MPARKIVAIVVPEGNLRRSLEFVLESEGFEVDSHVSASQCSASPRKNSAACTILDEDVIRDGGASFVVQLAKPIVLLVTDSPNIDVLSMDLTVVVKPFLGPSLIEAVRHAIALQGRH